MIPKILIGCYAKDSVSSHDHGAFAGLDFDLQIEGMSSLRMFECGRERGVFCVSVAGRF